MTDKEYKESFKTIRSYVNFNIDLRKKLSRSDKILITKYINQFKDIYQGMNIKVYRSRNKKNLNTVQDSFHQVTKTLPAWKVAFVPYTSRTAPSLRVKNGRVYLKNITTKLKHYTLPITDRLAFVSDPFNYVTNLLEKAKVAPRERLQVMTGDYLSTAIYDAENLAEEIEDWVNTYGGDKAANFILGFKSVYYR